MDVLYPQKAELGLEQMRRISSVLVENADIRRILENPTISGERRKAIITKITGPIGLDPVVRNLLSLLVDRNRLDIVDEIVERYQTLLDEKLGVVRANVRSAFPLDAAQQKEVAAKLEALTGKQVRIEVSVDKSLIGGVVAQVGSTIYDGSIRQQLEVFKHRLLQD
jgi:F-type H+-transporting ATPase subunit delta